MWIIRGAILRPGNSPLRRGGDGKKKRADHRFLKRVRSLRRYSLSEEGKKGGSVCQTSIAERAIGYFARLVVSTLFKALEEGGGRAAFSLGKKGKNRSRAGRVLFPGPRGGKEPAQLCRRGEEEGTISRTVGGSYRHRRSTL